MNVTKQYFRYVSQNIFGLIGTSCYILADTYFIAQAAGTDGVAMLNLCLPIYNFIFAFGSMIGLGSATRYAILKAQNDERAHRYFSNGLMCAILIAVPFMLVGAFCPDAVLRLMGGDAAIVALGLQYTRIFLLFTPFFMCNYIVSAFTRNDGDPSLAMVATLSGSLFNVVFDYIFIFPMGWGLPGAALALAAALYLVVFGFTDALVAIFNSENSALMARYAFTGMRIYFIGYLFAGFNIVSSGYLSAVNRPTEASITSISRGVVAIVACSLVLSALFGMNGVWAAFPASEAMTVVLTLFLLRGKRAAG